MSRLSTLIRAWKARCLGAGSASRPAEKIDVQWLQEWAPEATANEPTPEQPPRYKPRRLDMAARAVTNSAALEYPELGTGRLASTGRRRRPVFVTGRFRSGSTLLWNILRHTPGITAYYEPLHPTLQQPPEQRVPALDPTHDGVDEYWAEYRAIEGLASGYTQPWHCRDLYLDAADWQPALAEYLRLLIRSAPRLPVLQFNRVDFRLAWLRHEFPEARLVHLFRHPRDQWLSTLRDPKLFGPTDSKERFIQHDYFFLGDWVTDLAAQFPVLDWDRVEHPYAMFYLLWKLSYLWGKTYSDISIAYEQLLAAPRSTISQLYELLEFDPQWVSQVVDLVHPKGTGKWRQYADADWFLTHERHAESLLNAFLGPANDSVQLNLRAAS